MKPAFKIILGLLTVIIIAAGIFLYFEHQKYFPSTDDAYLQANVIQIAPQISGAVIEIKVQNHQSVKKGQLLFVIDPKPFELAVTKAQAQLKQTQQTMEAQAQAVKSAEALVTQRQAELVDVQKNYERTMTMVRKHLMAIAAGDDIQSKLNETQAELQAAQSELSKVQKQLGDEGEQNAAIQQAKAELAQAELNLSYTKITAATDGILVNFSLRKGDVVNANQTLFSIVENELWWVEANFKETDVARIRPGQNAVIKIDMYPGVAFNGKVDSISRGSDSAFSLFPAENATGNWVKVTQRIPVKVLIIRPDQNYPLRIGASSTVIVDTKNSAK